MTSSDQLSDTHLPTSEPVEISRPTVAGHWRTIALACGAALLVSLVVIGYLSIQLSRSKEDAIERDAVESAVSHFVIELTTYDHSTVQKDIAEVLALSTGSFQKEYKDVLGGDAFTQALTEAKGSSGSKIVSVFVTDISEERAETIVVLDQTVTNEENTQPKTERRRLEVTLVKTSKGWKADRVSVI